MLRDVLGFLWARKAIWLLPIVLALLIVAALSFATEASIIAPFVYPLF